MTKTAIVCYYYSILFIKEIELMKTVFTNSVMLIRYLILNWILTLNLKYMDTFCYYRNLMFAEIIICLFCWVLSLTESGICRLMARVGKWIEPADWISPHMKESKVTGGIRTYSDERAVSYSKSATANDF